MSDEISLPALTKFRSVRLMMTGNRKDESLAGLADASSLPMITIDPRSDRVVAANAAAGRYLGLAREALVGSPFSRLHPGQLPALIVFCDAVLSLGSYWTRDLKPRHGLDEDIKAEYRGDRLDAAGDPLILITMIDLKEQERRTTDTAANRFWTSGIAEWQRVERVFRDIERENQLILRAAGEGIYGVNAQGLTTFVNPAAEAILGWSAEELVGQDMHALVHHHHQDGRPYHNHDCPIYAAFRDGAVHTVGDEVFWHKAGKAIPVEYTSTPIRDRGVVVGAVIVFRDVTQRKEAEEGLHRALAEVQDLRARLERENAYLKEEIRIGVDDRGIIGRSQPIETLRRQIGLVAGTDATVLITGESGTGKELIARAIHEASGRGSGPLIRVNCAAIPRDLFESEFFGHVKGAFTGALRDRIGRFELADGGTLFLDEVGEIPIELQGKLLRVLQESQFERVGDDRTRSVDVRIVAATNRDLKTEVRAGRFREDLYFRLNVFPVQSAPLRERKEDIPLLVAHFLASPGRKRQARDVRISEADIQRLQAYGWPGNVRELQNVLERAMILSQDERLVIDLPAPEATSIGRDLPDVHLIRTDADRRRAEREDIVEALKRAAGKVSGHDGAAAILGIKPTTLASRIKKHGLDTAAFRT
ncbi:MAG: sigma 54-interacting transcriptional regulator [Flavobacteriaceae bacterium]